MTAQFTRPNPPFQVLSATQDYDYWTLRKFEHKMMPLFVEPMCVGDLHHGINHGLVKTFDWFMEDRLVKICQWSRSKRTETLILWIPIKHSKSTINNFEKSFPLACFTFKVVITAGWANEWQIWLTQRMHETAFISLTTRGINLSYDRDLYNRDSKVKAVKSGMCHF